MGGTRGNIVSPTTGTVKTHLSRVESMGRPESPMGNGRNEDFATGYSLGLIGGVRAWVSKPSLRMVLPAIDKCIDAQPAVPPRKPRAFTDK
jgi:hypothetical protein